jgi:hypothetical protein
MTDEGYEAEASAEESEEDVELEAWVSADRLPRKSGIYRCRGERGTWRSSWRNNALLVFQLSRNIRSQRVCTGLTTGILLGSWSTNDTEHDVRIHTGGYHL